MLQLVKSFNNPPTVLNIKFGAGAVVAGAALQYGSGSGSTTMTDTATCSSGFGPLRGLCILQKQRYTASLIYFK
jgi:hypothetical protein